MIHSTYNKSQKIRIVALPVVNVYQIKIRLSLKVKRLQYAIVAKLAHCHYGDDLR